MVPAGQPAGEVQRRQPRRVEGAKIQGAVAVEDRPAGWSPRSAPASWSSDDLLAASFRTYERLPEEIRKALPLKRSRTLVLDEAGPSSHGAAAADACGTRVRTSARLHLLLQP
jgi:hypothetical protein